MPSVLLLPGDGQGPEAIAAADTVICSITDRVEVTYGDIGMSAYEKCGEPLPFETLDLVTRSPVIISGPTATLDGDDGVRNPLRGLLSQINLYARSRTFRTLSGDLGRPGAEITVWGSIMNPQADIVETPDVDGMTISKYIRTEFYARTMSAALADFEMSGKTSAMSIARDDLFRESSRMFYDSFDVLFQSADRKTGHMNILDWISETISDPERQQFVIVADLYAMIAESVAAGITGGDALSPTKLVGADQSFIMPGSMDNLDVNSASSITAASVALADLGFRDESERVIKALKETVAAGERPTDMGGPLTLEEFVDSVTSRF